MLKKEIQKSKAEISSTSDLFHNEKIRIMKKGPQAFIGLGVTIFWFCFFPKLVYPLYSLISTFNVTVIIVFWLPFTGLMLQLIINLIMNNIYSSKYPYFEQYRIMKKPWPWEVDEIGYKKHYQEIVINTVIGGIVIVPLIAYIPSYFNLVEYLSDIELYPSAFESFKQTIFRMIVFETLFYWNHRLFHTSWFFKKFHKQHHEYKVTVSIATIYNHPFDFVITNLIPQFGSLIALRKTHLITEFYWNIFVTVFAVFIHCGYNMPWFPWSIFPLGLNIDYHDFHHSSIGNYGIFFNFWDTVCGTNKLYYKSIAKEEEKLT